MRYFRLIFAGVFILFMVTCTNKSLPLVKMETELGNIIIELYQDKAPVTCANFLQYIDNDLFSNALFYRVVKLNNQALPKNRIEVVQWGLYLDDNEYVLPPIIHESTQQTGILHEDGVISMARNEPGTASSEFFICIGDQPELDYGGKRNPDLQGFAAFGKVVKGMDVIRKIHQMPDTNQYLVNQVKIKSVKHIN